MIDYAKEHPTGNFVFAGDPGTGKTHIGYALFRHAIENDRPHTLAITLKKLIDQFRHFALFKGEDRVYPRVDEDMLRQSEGGWTIFLEDIDKANPTDYAAQETFALLNALHEQGHQLIVTTNKRLDDLQQHFDRSDDRGGAIVRRIIEGAKIFNTFR